MDKKVAFFVDGGFFIQRVKYHHRHYFASQSLTADVVLRVLIRLVSYHQKNLKRDDLYRVYYYDAPPLEKQVREPVPRNGHQGLTTRNFKASDDYLFQTELHKALMASRKVALRMGELSGGTGWLLKDDVLSQLLKNELKVADLQPDHFRINVRQKGVDTRIGIDVTSVTLNKLVDTIVLLAGDADFVPVAKFARTHGVDVVLDPLYSSHVSPSLLQHIDGKTSFDLVACLKAAFDGKEPDIQPNWWQSK